MKSTTQYWYDTLSEILPDHGINIDIKTLESLASDIADAAEMQGEATGEIYIGSGGESEIEKVRKEAAKSIREMADRHEERLRVEKAKYKALYQRALAKIEQLEKQIYG